MNGEHSFRPVARSVLVGLLVLLPLRSAALFDSGSTGENGPFPPDGAPSGAVSIVLNLHTGSVTYQPGGQTQLLMGIPAEGFADGILKFTTFKVPPSTTLTFVSTVPVDIRAQGDVEIDGTIDLSGKPGGDQDVGGGGTPGPGGFSGGQGGISLDIKSGTGLGPGGGGPGGGGGGFGLRGRDSLAAYGGIGGSAYGTDLLRSLIGGSGGGGQGRSEPDASFGPSGGGGGGAIGIASSTAITIGGQIVADGGAGGHPIDDPSDADKVGGGGAGGGIRLVANKIAGSGVLFARGGTGTPSSPASAGGAGRVRLETFDLQFDGTVDAVRTDGIPGPIDFPDPPTIRIAKVGGIDVPAFPNGASGNVDVIISSAGSTTVEVVTNRIPTNTAIMVCAKASIGSNADNGAIATVVGGNDPRTTPVNIELNTGLFFIEARLAPSPTPPDAICK